MKINIDKEVDIAYIYIKSDIQEGEVKKSIEVNENIILDFDNQGKLLGIEVINASENLSEELINSVIKPYPQTI